jgi:hypothetical protein
VVNQFAQEDMEERETIKNKIMLLAQNNLYEDDYDETFQSINYVKKEILLGTYHFSFKYVDHYFEEEEEEDEGESATTHLKEENKSKQIQANKNSGNSHGGKGKIKEKNV